MPDWAKTGIIIGGILASNFVTGGLQYGLKTRPTLATSEERKAYGAVVEERLYSCQDRLTACYNALNECQAR